MTEIEFTPWPKTHRLYRPVIVTEKIDGTNAAIGVTEDGRVYAQSHKRLITPDDDNHGFARWVSEDESEIRDMLGPGLHFGEWFGPGIGKRYSKTTAPGFGPDKWFALFNVKRWTNVALPDGVTTVPVLYEGTFDQEAIDTQLRLLRNRSSRGEPSPSGTLRPEGIVVFHAQSNQSFKVTIENDEMSKQEAERRQT